VSFAQISCNTEILFLVDLTGFVFVAFKDNYVKVNENITKTSGTEM